MSSTTESYDRLSELKAFDDTKAGVKGLVDAGITSVPAIFRHPHQQLSSSSCSSISTSTTTATRARTIPAIDLSASEGPDARARWSSWSRRSAAETAGFFHLVNHGVPRELLSDALSSVRRFHESPPEAKRPYYTRDLTRRVRFNSNFDLFQSPAANWRDTLFFAAAPDEPPLAEEELPAAVRRAVPAYAAAARGVAARVLGLLSEALGLPRGRLAAMGCADGASLVCNYYPPCPEPCRTMGCSAHSDPSFLTLLLQEPHAQGGLQARLGDGEEEDGWVDVPPVGDDGGGGGLLVNVGDLLQLVSNGRFRSVEHRVVANWSGDTARVSVACFFNADIARSTRLYGPIEELLARPSESDGGDGGGARAVYRSVTVQEFLAHYDKKGLDGRPALHHFLLPQ
ncbi:LOW QUALITY PROTEIN: hypothetical protein U9M48_036684 [Paspalum notatum var. saurae]|uniref:Fe2OG dioxygenase domain-containing protein n=1 Tax=Paspalum notatum var. saurae TaxID=547442 RepID=A0AAQ3UI35_PASNO